MEKKESIYHGTYPIRKAAKGESVIHMPTMLAGEFSIYEQENGDLLLKKAGVKAKPG